MFLPLVRGAALVMVNQSSQKDPFQLLDVIRDSKVTVVQATPTTYEVRHKKRERRLCEIHSVEQKSLQKTYEKKRSQASSKSHTEINSHCSQLDVIHATAYRCYLQLDGLETAPSIS